MSDDEMVDELRERACPLSQRAADRLEAQQAEIARLREALTRIIALDQYWPDHPPAFNKDDGEYAAIARAALEVSDEAQ